MKVYTTKYALTAGIGIETVEYGSDDEKYVYTKDKYWRQFVMGQNAFLTYKEAAVAAREMRSRKVISLQKQLAKVSGMTFPTKMPDNLK